MDFRRAGFDSRPFIAQNPKVRHHGLSNCRGFHPYFSSLARLVLPQGVIDIDRNIPPNDVPLIGSTSKVLVRSDLHPEIVQLLLQTMVEVHGGSKYLSAHR